MLIVSLLIRTLLVFCSNIVVENVMFTTRVLFTLSSPIISECVMSQPVGSQVYRQIEYVFASCMPEFSYYSGCDFPCR